MKEFDIRRWRGKWWFGLSLLGLLAGALLTRRVARPERDFAEKADPGQTPEELSLFIDRPHRFTVEYVYALGR